MASQLMTTEALEAVMRALDPRVRLVTPRVLRRIIKSEQKSGTGILYVAHRRSLTISAAAALRAVTAKDLRLDDSTSSGTQLLLIAEPDPALPYPQALTWAWRRLFHARLHAEFREKVANGQLNNAKIAERIAEIGVGVFDEARSVLERDGLLLSPDDDAATYEEFATIYLELGSFAESLRPVYFPRIEDFDHVQEVLTRDLDAPSILAATRPEGAPLPSPHVPVDDPPMELEGPATDDVPRRSEARARSLLARADRARALGNVVRSALLRTRASRIVGPTLAGKARAGAVDDMESLARRLADAVGPEPLAAPNVVSALGALVASSENSRWPWSVATRLLYDLQKVCVDHEREIYALDLVGWITGDGKRSIKRPLPNQRVVRMSRHLRRASARVSKVRLREADRADVSALIHEMRERVQAAVRDRFRPLVARSFDRGGVMPGNLPERVSFDRMTEELLDRLVDHDHLTMGDARDAIARSDLRQPDLAGPRDLWLGDRVLKVNRRLAVSLDGVYRGGEVYLRALQSLSFLAFGTVVGRWLTRFVALPFGGAFGLLFTIQELIETAQKLVAAPLGIKLHHEDFPRFTNFWTVGIVGIVALLILHSVHFRTLAIRLATGMGRFLKFLLYDGPAWLLSRPLVVSILNSRLFDVLRRVLIQPLLLAAGAFGLVYAIDRDLTVATGIGGVIFAAAALFLGTAFGREVEEIAVDATIRGWKRISTDLLPGLVRLILDVFDAILQGVEAVLYAVDERLRFRAGEGKWTLRAKAIASLIWGAITYVVRIYINLLVEPTINPLKHFPTVTVAAKLIIPVLGHLYRIISGSLWFLGAWPAGAFATLTVVFLPGLAGFIVWELKENWRLFEANRPKTLQPMVIGHHGETMRRLLLPGFHSGTIPKLFAKLRKAERLAYRTGERASARKARESLHHVEEPIRDFIERGFVTILAGSGRFGPDELNVEDVELATNQVVVVVGPSDGEGRMRLRFETERGELATVVDDEGWLDGLSPERREIADAAILGAAARAGAVQVAGDFPTDVPIGAPVDLGRSTNAVVIWSRWVEYWDRTRVGSASKPPVSDAQKG